MEQTMNKVCGPPSFPYLDQMGADRLVEQYIAAGANRDRAKDIANTMSSGFSIVWLRRLAEHAKVHERRLAKYRRTQAITKFVRNLKRRTLPFRTPLT